MYENMPYSNFHDLNTDWIVKKIKDVETSEANAKTSEENAAASEANARQYELSAQGFALQANNNAHYAHEQAQAAAQSAEDAAETVSNTNAQVNLLQSRVDNIIPSGTQTEGNTELLDIRVGYNGVTYSSAGDAVRGGDENIVSLMNDIRTAYGENLFNRETLYPGQYVSADGSIATGAQYTLTDYIPVNGAFYVTIPHTGTISSCWYSFYDSDKVFQQRTSYPQTAFTLNYTGFIRINLWNENNAAGHHNIDEIMINNGNTAKPFTPYYTAYDKTARNSIETLQNAFIGKGTLPNDTDLNDVTDTGIYILNTSFTYQNIPMAGAAYLLTFNVDPNVKMQIWLKYSGSTRYYRNKLNDTWGSWQSMDIKKESKLAMLGDSITWGQLGGQPAGTQTNTGIPYWVNLLSNAEAVNLAIGGMGWLTHQYQNQNAYEYIQTLNLSTYDAVYMAYGINDSDQSLGTYLDTSTDTIMGSIYNTMMYLKTNYPQKTFILVSPTLGANYNSSFPLWNWDKQRTGGWTLQELTEEYKKFADYYHVPFIDLSQSPVNSFNVDVLTGGANDIHLIQKGYDLLGKYIAGYINRILG